MQNIIPIFLSILTLQTPTQVNMDYTYPLGIVPNIETFPFQSEALADKLELIDPLRLRDQTFSIEENEVMYTFTLTYTNEGAIIQPLVGLRPFLSKVALNDTHAFIEIFNPTANDIHLDTYGLNINQAMYLFNEGLILNAMTAVTLDVMEGVVQPGTIGPDDPIITTWPIDEVKLWDGTTFLIIDRLPISTMIDTAYGEASLTDHVFARFDTMATAPFEYDLSTWFPMSNDETFVAHALYTPYVTPLMQAKAWGHDVMFGVGMNNANREVEAYEAIADELWLMDPASLEAIYDNPTASFQGINEQGRLTTATVTQAVKRYNRLSTYLPGASSLVDPLPSDDTFSVFLSTAVITLGLVSVVVFLRYRKKDLVKPIKKKS
jgi:hypothetical protein